VEEEERKEEVVAVEAELHTVAEEDAVVEITTLDLTK
jgi:hypothetical protein